MNSEPNLRDLVPAGLAKTSGDGLPIISANYTKMGESLRRNAPNEMQCSMFCGGRRCKYESSTHWKASDMALDGLFSHWITDDILAMARPNDFAIRKFKIIEQFKQQGISSIINLQMTGEHSKCGPNLHESGFTYDPNEFMKNKIFFYNFTWRDYGEASMSSLLDMVKVVSFALTEGKVAIHCHAGLGRTGVLVAAYLIYSLRVRANDAIRYVRFKRPGSVQTSKQIECVKEFEAYFLPQCLIYSSKPPGDPDKKMGRFSIELHLKRQKYLLHGFEARSLKYIPKIVYKICERLLKLCGCEPCYSATEADNFSKTFISYNLEMSGDDPKMIRLRSSTASSTNSASSVSIFPSDQGSRQSLYEALSAESSGFHTPSNSASRPNSETVSVNNLSRNSALSGVDKMDDYLDDGVRNQPINDNLVTKELENHLDLRKLAASEQLPLFNPTEVVEALLETHYVTISQDNRQHPDVVLFSQYKVNLNYKSTAWDRLDTETNLWVLTALLLEWLEHLKFPLLERDSITYIVIHCDNLEVAMKKLPAHVCFILEYIVRFVARLKPLDREDCEDIMRRFVASLTHQSVIVRTVAHPAGKKFAKLRGGTAESTLKFLMKLYDRVDDLFDAMPKPSESLISMNHFPTNSRAAAIVAKTSTNLSSLNGIPDNMDMDIDI